MKTIFNINRFLLAALFLFSGFVKGVDPLGTHYKIEDYLLAYNMDWALPFSLGLAFALIALELSLGSLLLLNLMPKFTRIILALLMGFFTLVTFYDALYNPVSDCGCFGDALILTNWQTFYKNIFLDVLVVFLFVRNPKKTTILRQFLWSSAIYLVFLGFLFYNINHLPLIDFGSWKIGNQIYNPNKKPTEIYLTYKNIQSEETQEFLSPNFPYQDTTWMKEWKYVSTHEVDPNPPTNDLLIFDLEGKNVSNEILGYSDKCLLLVSHSLDEIDEKKAGKIKKLVHLAEQESISVFLITASVGNTLTEFEQRYQLNMPYFLADDTALKTIVRSNPGLILLENGIVLKKWAYADFPQSADQILD
jgi:uncharacterized membrane protein YphA (DoxX/SURF4 family)